MRPSNVLCENHGRSVCDSKHDRSASDFLFAWLTLAGTSVGRGVGRGWDTVGHAAGCYRNRITIR